jgi:hypothetical protein
VSGNPVVSQCDRIFAKATLSSGSGPSAVFVVDLEKPVEGQQTRQHCRHPDHAGGDAVEKRGVDPHAQRKQRYGRGEKKKRKKNKKKRGRLIHLQQERLVFGSDLALAAYASTARNTSTMN